MGYDPENEPTLTTKERKLLFGLEIEKKESRKPKRSSRAGTVRALQIDKMYLLTRTYTTI